MNKYRKAFLESHGHLPPVVVVAAPVAKPVKPTPVAAVKVVKAPVKAPDLTEAELEKLTAPKG